MISLTITVWTVLIGGVVSLAVVRLMEYANAQMDEAFECALCIVPQDRIERIVATGEVDKELMFFALSSVPWWVRVVGRSVQKHDKRMHHLAWMMNHTALMRDLEKALQARR